MSIGAVGSNVNFRALSNDTTQCQVSNPQQYHYGNTLQHDTVSFSGKKEGKKKGIGGWIAGGLGVAALVTAGIFCHRKGDAAKKLFPRMWDGCQQYANAACDGVKKLWNSIFKKSSTP